MNDEHVESNNKKSTISTNIKILRVLVFLLGVWLVYRYCVLF